MSSKLCKRSITRRKFLGQTSAAGAVLWGARPLLAAEGAKGANERFSIGIIGAGGRASSLIKEIQSLAQSHNAEITAVCDVWKVNLDKAAATVKKWWGKEPRKFTRFGDLLALADVDAVVIATPDFGHCPIMVAALEAGKDVYVEKPMSMDVETANQALDLARQRSRVVQCGTQRRSDGLFIAAGKLLSSGVLGQISRVTAEVNLNEPRWARSYSDCKQPDVDWDAYLFNRPKQPFDPKLLRRWHLYKLFTNGLSGLWMSHYVDAVHMVLRTTYPASAVAHGGTYVWKEDRQHADTLHALLEYPEGFLMSWGMGLGNSAGTSFSIHGTLGTLDFEQWLLSPAGGKNTKLQQQKITAEKSASHMGNWLECIRSRQRPNADIQYGHQHAVATIMAAAAMETGQRQKYDPQKRQILAG